MLRDLPISADKKIDFFRELQLSSGSSICRSVGLSVCRSSSRGVALFFYCKGSCALPVPWVVSSSFVAFFLCVCMLCASLSLGVYTDGVISRR